MLPYQLAAGSPCSARVHYQLRPQGRRTHLSCEPKIRIILIDETTSFEMWAVIAKAIRML